MKTQLPIVMLFAMFLMIPVAVCSEPLTYTCTYSSYSDGKKVQKVEKEFKLIFIVDTTRKTAYMVANMGSTELTMYPKIKGGISFVEITGAGNVMTTSIDSKLNSVHSRNTIIDGDLIPTQYYGVCKLQE